MQFRITALRVIGLLAKAVSNEYSQPKSFPRTTGLPVPAEILPEIMPFFV